MFYYYLLNLNNNIYLFFNENKKYKEKKWMKNIVIDVELNI